MRRISRAHKLFEWDLDPLHLVLLVGEHFSMIPCSHVVQGLQCSHGELLQKKFDLHLHLVFWVRVQFCSTSSPCSSSQALHLMHLSEWWLVSVYSFPSEQNTHSGIPPSCLQSLVFRLPGGQGRQQNWCSRCRPSGQELTSVIFLVNFSTSELIPATWAFSPLDNGPATEINISDKRTQFPDMAVEQSPKWRSLSNRHQGELRTRWEVSPDWPHPALQPAWKSAPLPGPPRGLTHCYSRDAFLFLQQRDRKSVV